METSPRVNPTMYELFRRLHWLVRTAENRCLHAEDDRFGSFGSRVDRWRTLRCALGPAVRGSSVGMLHKQGRDRSAEEIEDSDVDAESRNCWLVKAAENDLSPQIILQAC